MLRKIFLGLTFLLLATSVFCQSNNESVKTINDTIKYTKVTGGYLYEKDGKRLSLNELRTLMQGNVEAAKIMDKTRGTMGLVTALGYAGGFMIGYPLGASLGGKKADWSLAIIGCGIIAVALPIAHGADKNVKNAVELYNKGKLTAQNKIDFNYELKFGVTQNGIGFVMQF